MSMVQKGLSPEVAAKNLGFNRSTIYAWLKAYSSSGKQALAAKPISGRPAKLNSKQIRWICKAITSDTIQRKFKVCIYGGYFKLAKILLPYIGDPH